MKRELLYCLFITAFYMVMLFSFEYKYDRLKQETLRAQTETINNAQAEIMEISKQVELEKQKRIEMTEKYEAEKSKRIKIENENMKLKKQENLLIGSSKFGSEDALILHKISIAEAGGESIESMALVMLVILNRVSDDNFPDSIEDIVFQKSRGVAQFTPTIDGNYNDAKPNEKSKAAMELILNGWDESKGALFFEACSGESWHGRNLELLFEKDGIRYYK